MAEPKQLEQSDRAFHDWLFSQIDRDRLSFYYTGYVTIKRFGDLIAPYVEDCRRVLDAGCGPGEITCYLAQRFPETTFLGIDHSKVGIHKAERNRNRLGLENVRFEARDLVTNPPEGRFDIVLFLDSFHHFTNPAGVVDVVQGMADRVLLLEPHGDAAGNWVRAVDFDWLNAELHRIRRVMNRLLGDEDSKHSIDVDQPLPPDYSPSAPGDAIEHRYPPQFYEELLRGFDLDVRGTISGLTTYGENIYEKTESNRLFNRVLADVFASIDDRLTSTGRDILAKHWIIYGEKKVMNRGRVFDGFTRYRKFAPELGAPSSVPPDFYDVAYADCQLPLSAPPASQLFVWVHVINEGSATWSSSDPHHPVNLGYHWLTPAREMVTFDGYRTTLGGKPLGPHDCAYLEMRIVTPEDPGRYILQVDMVHEHIAWFSAKGRPPVEREILIAK
jgi:SAM-dependent methyltransferase